MTWASRPPTSRWWWAAQAGAYISRAVVVRLNGDLTDRGIAQAEHLAETLRAARPDYGLLVYSPRRRARQTAQIVSARLHLPVAAELDDLREINVGDLDGHNDDRVWQVYQATLAAWRSGQLGQRFPAGESGYELATRIGRGLRAVAGQAGAEHAVVVAHGASSRAAVPALTGQPEPGTDLATGGVARITVTQRPGSAADIAVAAWP